MTVEVLDIVVSLTTTTAQKAMLLSLITIGEEAAYRGQFTVNSTQGRANNGMYKVNIIEKKTMGQDVVADAESLAGSIHQTGKASVYDIISTRANPR